MTNAPSDRWTQASNARWERCLPDGRVLVALRPTIHGWRGSITAPGVWPVSVYPGPDYPGNYFETALDAMQAVDRVAGSSVT
jgi:hypothetical protein